MGNAYTFEGGSYVNKDFTVPKHLQWEKMSFCLEYHLFQKEFNVHKSKYGH